MKKGKGIIALFLMSVMLLLSCFTAFAGDDRNAYQEMIKAVKSGEYNANTGKAYDTKENKYKTTGGGYLLYSEIVDTTGDANTIVNSVKFETLTQSGKKQFLTDMITVANAMAYDTETGTDTLHGVTTETVNDMMLNLQNLPGAGSQLLAALLSQTRPDFATANKIYTPFAGPVGTALGLISILIMAALGLTMALDLAYIVIPVFQMACGGSEGGGAGGPGGGGKKNSLGGFISSEAKAAVKAAEGGGGGQAGSGEYKAAVGIYLKHRWIGLSILGLCLLYLVQGQIYNFVAWFVDLFSGFLGF